MMIKEYISDLSYFPFKDVFPWEITSRLKDYLMQLIDDLSVDYRIEEGVAIHKSAQRGPNVTIKAPAII